MDEQQPVSLAGVRVLDLSRILAGPTATQLLADLGADVVKVERPCAGDDTRGWGPPFLPGPAGEAESDLTAYFLAANRNKQSIAIDFSTEEGAALIRRLAAVSDVVVENYKPGDLASRGLGYEDLRLVKPDLVWCSISGFGQTGPYADRVGYDFLIQAMGGIMSLTGEPDGQPLKVGVGIADVMCGMYATVGVLAALRHRDRTGEGQRIDLALYDSQLAWLVNAATGVLVSGEAPRRLGNRHPNIAPYQTFPTGTGNLAVAVGNDAQFRRFAEVIDRPELAADPRFARNRDRVRAIDVLDPLITAALATAPAEVWAERLTTAGVPAGLVAGVDAALADPHTRARGMVIEMEGPEGRPLRLLGNPLKFSATPVRYHTAPPRLDQDRAAVFAMLEAAEATSAELADR